MRPPSSEAQTLAGLGADLFVLAFAALALFAGVDRSAPPQDLPWKPLRLSDPLGMATAYKLQRATVDPGDCLSFIEREGVAFSQTSDRTDGGFCVVQSAGAVGPQGLRLSPAAPVMTCRLAAAFALWTRQSVRPAARMLLGSEAVQIDHYGTYACRRVYGRAEGRPSEHARAEAIDVASFRLADGRRIDVLKDWNGAGARSDFLHRVRDEGCRLFRVSLSPDYNAQHRNHLHLAMNAYRMCR